MGRARKQTRSQLQTRSQADALASRCARKQTRLQADALASERADEQRGWQQRRQRWHRGLAARTADGSEDGSEDSEVSTLPQQIAIR